MVLKLNMYCLILLWIICKREAAFVVSMFVTALWYIHYLLLELSEKSQQGMILMRPFNFGAATADAVTEFIEGLVETYPGLQYLDGFPEVRFFQN